MLRKVITYITYPILIAGLVLGLFGVAHAANIDSTNKYAWGTNVGWISFNPAHGGGVTVYSDHLEGYAWAENVGWIRLGTYEAGGTHTYANTDQTNYGVNNDGQGNLSGYAWGTNVGWIHFNPTHGGVTINPTNGDFNGYAWGENIGWIHFQNSSPAYKVTTDWLGIDGSIDSTNKYAWATSAGWLNFNPTHGDEVKVFSDHLEGHAWGENIGWVRLGTHDSGGTHTYTNADQTTYGVNNDGVGNLSGYAWATNAGWINFNPTHGQVWVDPVTGDFEGYAWSENAGWIHFQNASPAYKVTTNWHGDLLSTYQNNIAAIITTHRTSAASSAGLTIANSTFLNQAGDGIIFGHDNAAFANVTTNLASSSADKRWARIWQLDTNDQGGGGGNVDLTFDISDAGGSGNFDAGGTYYLLKRATGSSDDFTDVTVVGTSVSGDQLTFTVNASNLGSEFTIGATADSPTVVNLPGFSARSVGQDAILSYMLAGLAALAVGGLGVVWRRRRRAVGSTTNKERYQ